VVKNKHKTFSDYELFSSSVKRPDPLGLKCDTITSPRRLVNTFIFSNSTESRLKVITIPNCKL
jgi:hypothetical protein